MHLFKVEDPRDELAKATRDELWDFAKARGVIPAMLDYMNRFVWTPDKGFAPRPEGFIASQANVTKEDMVHWLRNRGETNFRAAVRIMGRPIDMPQPVAPAPAEPPKIEAPVNVPIDEMTMGQLKKEAKRRGLVIPRTAKKPEVLERLKAA